MKARTPAAGSLPLIASNGRNDHEGARDLAEAAGRLLLEIRAALGDGMSSDEVRRRGDRRSHEILVALLARDFPGDAVLSEEGTAPTRAFEGGRLWIIDPLDGTREFGEADRDDWAVHVALVEGEALAAGAVALPARDVTYGTLPAHELVDVEREVIRIAVSRTRPALEAERLASCLGGELVPMGSAGAKAMAVLCGTVDVYLHSGGQYVWDSAAPVAVALAAGLHASRLDGSKLVYGLETTWLPDLVICRPKLRDTVLEALRMTRV